MAENHTRDTYDTTIIVKEETTFNMCLLSLAFGWLTLSECGSFYFLFLTGFHYFNTSLLAES